MAIDWLIEMKIEATKEISHSFLSQTRNFGMLGNLSDQKANAAQGISGLIYLGAAWESIDIFYNLATALAADEHSSLAQLALLRGREIERNGGKSLIAKKMNWDGRFGMLNDKKIIADNEKFFIEARVEAEERQAVLTAFMDSKFEKGLHPDTHKDFWTGLFYDKEPPKYNGETIK